MLRPLYRYSKAETKQFLTPLSCISPPKSISDYGNFKQKYETSRPKEAHLIFINISKQIAKANEQGLQFSKGPIRHSFLRKRFFDY